MKGGGIVYVFWDIGGVLLTNGWDRHARADAARRFHFDHADFEARHARVIDDFDSGRMGLDEYMTETLFFREREFTPEAFRAFMYAQSKPFPDVLRIAETLADDPQCFMAALNNESLPINQYRIEEFQLRRYFRCFFSSCYLGVRKPDRKIYELALQLTQALPEECVFIDDRPENLEPARTLKMRAVRFSGADQLKKDLERERTTIRTTM
jgi:putative hydrolase of the HAD superfamily